MSADINSYFFFQLRLFFNVFYVLCHVIFRPIIPKRWITADAESFSLKDIWTMGKIAAAMNPTSSVNDKGSVGDESLLLITKFPSESRLLRQLEALYLYKIWLQRYSIGCTTVGHSILYGCSHKLAWQRCLLDAGVSNRPYCFIDSPRQRSNLSRNPDPEAVFDLLMARGSTFKPHTGKLSSIFFYLATVLTHDIFQTDPEDHGLNKASSYLDLSPLYGYNGEEQKNMRLYKDGRIKSDCFAAKRFLSLPPGAGVLLIMFNRFHNYVVEQLIKINENGRFSVPTQVAKGDRADKTLAERDEKLFQVGRHITCGLYASIILKDYIRTILNVQRRHTTWYIEPRSTDEDDPFLKSVPQGNGNRVSVEFNLAYRWHSTLSERDERWVTKNLREMLNGQDPKMINYRQFIAKLHENESIMNPKQHERPFAGMQRDADGTYPDVMLCDIFTSSVEDIASSFGARRVPDSLRAVEILGIVRSRQWEVGSLNEYRESIGLQRHATFQDINPDPEIIEAMSRLYNTADDVELYPGLIVEQTSPRGLCSNLTSGYAILMDALSLVRGDPYHTTNFTKENLTEWGHHEAIGDPDVDQGHVFYKLAQRAFPNTIQNDSIYAHFPFVLPEENYSIHQKLGTTALYTWNNSRKSWTSG